MALTASFGSVSAGPVLGVPVGHGFTWAITGTFAGTWILERSNNGGAGWTTVSTGTTTSTGTVVAEKIEYAYRFRCSAYTSGTIVGTMTRSTYTVEEWFNDDFVSVLRIEDENVVIPTLVLVTATLTTANVTTANITTANVTTLKTASMSTDDNAAAMVINIPVSGTDATGHTLSLQIDGNTGLSISATGDGAAGVGVRTIQLGVSGSADVVNIGDANAKVDITSEHWSMTEPGVLSLVSMGSNWTNAGRTVADAGVLTTVDVNGGSIDGTVIGANSAVTGKFTTVETLSIFTADNAPSATINIPVSGTDATGHTLSLQIDGNTAISISATGDGAAGVGARTISIGVSGAADVVNIGDANAQVGITSEHWSMTEPGVLSLVSMGSDWTNAGRTVADAGTLTTVDINGGSIDGTPIGAASASTVKASTLETPSIFTADNAATCTINIPVSGTDATGHTLSLQIDGNEAIGISATGDGAAGVGVRTINIGVSGAADVINVGDANAKVTLLSEHWGMTEPGVFTFVSMGGDWTNAGRTIADLGTVTTVDINGGSVDGAAVGAASASTGKFTTVETPSLFTADNAASCTINIPVSGTDATGHTLSLQIDGNEAIGISATGDGAAGVGVRTINIGVSGAADVINIGDANALVSITDAHWSVTDAGVLSIASFGANWTNAGRTVADAGILTTVDVNGGTVDSLTALSVRDTSAAFDLTIAATSSVALDAGRSVTVDVLNASRTLKLAGNIDIAGNFTTASALTFAGAFSSTITFTAPSAITMPVAGTLQTAVTIGDDAMTTSRETNVAGLSSAITLCTELLTDYDAHVADYGVGTEEHKALHSAGQLASNIAPTTLAELITKTNDLQTKYALHDVDAADTTPTYHMADVGGGNPLADATAVTTLQTSIAKLNDIKTKFNAHDADITGHRTGSKYQIAAAAADYGAAIAITATGALAGDLVAWGILNDGTGNVTGVSAVAGTNVITFTFSADPQNDAIISYICVPVGR